MLPSKTKYVYFTKACVIDQTIPSMKTSVQFLHFY